jgi:Protein-L-isoaspartate carboxylmethyltransferase
MKFSLSNFKSSGGGLDPARVSMVAQLAGAETFIETGTYLGDTVQAMLGVFKNVYSIELSQELYEQARTRFAEEDRVKLLLGDSSERLTEAAAASRDTSAIFWLDAHWSGGNTARAIDNTPIVSELKSIRSCDLENSVIMIDDLRYFIEVPTGFEVHEANYGYPLLRDLLAHIRDLWPERVSVINGDILFIFPREIYAQLAVTDVLSATGRLRSGQASVDELPALEHVIANAQGDEREVILALPDTFHHSLQYGIGGEYLYWRALVRERDGAFDQARSDFSLARRCDLAIPLRPWE